MARVKPANVSSLTMPPSMNVCIASGVMFTMRASSSMFSDRKIMLSRIATAAAWRGPPGMGRLVLSRAVA